MRTLLALISLLACTLQADPVGRFGAQVIGKLASADMNSTGDQAIRMNCSRYVIRRICVLNTSTSLTLAVGGIYTATSKGGSAVVAASQVYSGLTGSTKFLDLTLAAIATTDVRTEANLYLSLTVAQGGAATADCYILGDCLD